MWKTYKFEKSTCHKYFLVLDSYVLHLQDTTSVVDYEHVSSLLWHSVLPPPPLRKSLLCPWLSNNLNIMSTVLLEQQTLISICLHCHALPKMFLGIGYCLKIEEHAICVTNHDSIHKVTIHLQIQNNFHCHLEIASESWCMHNMARGNVLSFQDSPTEGE